MMLFSGGWPVGEKLNMFFSGETLGRKLGLSRAKGGLHPLVAKVQLAVELRSALRVRLPSPHRCARKKEHTNQELTAETNRYRKCAWTAVPHDRTVLAQFGRRRWADDARQ